MNNGKTSVINVVNDLLAIRPIGNWLHIVAHTLSKFSSMHDALVVEKPNCLFEAISFQSAHSLVTNCICIQDPWMQTEDAVRTGGEDFFWWGGGSVCKKAYSVFLAHCNCNNFWCRRKDYYSVIIKKAVLKLWQILTRAGHFRYFLIF